MYKLKLNNKLINFNSGTRVIDLIDKNEVKQYIVCKINQTIKELTYPLSEKNDNSEITLLTLEHKEAGRAYEATLRYIISMAFSNLYPDIDIKFNYNVSRSIFCEIFAFNVLPKTATGTLFTLVTVSVVAFKIEIFASVFSAFLSSKRFS